MRARWRSGAAAGLLGDRWNLGFLAETERQVVEHLDEHLRKLPREDEKSSAILGEMRLDEARHATTAIEHGAADLPLPVKGLMRIASGLYDAFGLLDLSASLAIGASSANLLIPIYSSPRRVVT